MRDGPWYHHCLICNFINTVSDNSSIGFMIIRQCMSYIVAI
ncbi:hypothetical protein HMPREF3196_02055 [Bifidobacterium bifidum]|uniref:Uncharacterized protein n=1 Tax=Bifidobacterium bifidum TaxID=1681 RepID=A0A133KKI3_BIFBI|nr:hypothetical protein HMPREF3196_02055 [Bifidobacterium bifidum]